jgi:phosphoenolpyruvate carboxykinase (GTP)
VADYFAHWLQMVRTTPKPPRIFSVNWFRKDANGKFLWPGYGENMRILKWVVERVNGHAAAVESPLGWMPRYEDLDWNGLDSVTREQFYELMSVDRDVWKDEIVSHEELFVKMYDRLPKEFMHIRELILSGLWRSPEHWEQFDPTAEGGFND